MDVSHHRDWRLNVHDIALLHQQLFSFGAYCFDHGVGEELLLIESADAFVEVNAGYTSDQLMSIPSLMVGAYLAGRALLNSRKGMSPQRARTSEGVVSGRTSFIWREKRKNAGSQHRQSPHQGRKDEKCRGGGVDGVGCLCRHFNLEVDAATISH